MVESIPGRLVGPIGGGEADSRGNGTDGGPLARSNCATADAAVEFADERVLVPVGSEAADYELCSQTMIDVRQFISRVKLGRPPTRLGNDGIDPWVSLPRRFTPGLVRRLNQEGVATRVRDFGAVDDDRYGVFVMLDELSFPGADPKRVQLVLDDWYDSLE